MFQLREKIKPLIPQSLIQIYRNLRVSFLYVGNDVECSVCGGHFRKMRDYHMPNRSSLNEVCPQCGAKSRHRLYALYFKSQGVIGANHRILHVAPDPGIRRLLEPENCYISIDLMTDHVHIKGNIQQLPFGSNSFDAIICSHVLEHVDDDRAAMGDMFRILKPGGWALLQTPLDNSNPNETYEDKTITDPQARLQHFGQEDHVRVYGEQDFYKRLQQAGFGLELNFAGSLSEETKSRFVLKNEELIIGRK